ncbi:MAG: 16S rRNA processing protein RimM [Clostridia bacterium]|nr:16S rRNA processing protein RimM [Clostridia bacterium]
MTKYLEIGQIVNTFGIKGEVKIKAFTDDITKFDDRKTIYIENKGIKQEYEIEQVKYHKNMVIIKFKGIENLEQAELLRNSYLFVDRRNEKPLEEGAYYIVDLIGLEVYEEGNLIGKVDDIYNTGSNDIYVIKDELGKQILLPGIPEVIKQIDLEGGKIIVHIIEGLV